MNPIRMDGGNIIGIGDPIRIKNLSRRIDGDQHNILRCDSGGLLIQAMAAGQGGRSTSTSACHSGQAALAARLLKHVAAGWERGNLVFSPLSIHLGIALMSAGARGPTLDEILRVAGGAPSRDALAEFVRSVVMEGTLADRSGIGGPSVAFSCGAWTDEAWALKPAYRDTVVGTYNGNSWTVDFRTNPVATRQHINNAWAAEATRNLITGILDPYKNSPHIIASAIYFKAEWHDPFDKDYTVCNFHCLDGGSIKTPFMRSCRSDHRLACHDGFKVLKLPYKDLTADLLSSAEYNLSKFSLCIFLPAARDGLPGLAHKIASYPNFLHDHLPTAAGPVGVVRLPKFKLTFDASISSVLKDLGLHLPFHQVMGDMTDMVEAARPGMYVHDVFHKAAVEVNEEGSEAAAVTTESDSIMGFSLCEDYVPPPEKPANFIADHPFAFFIVEEISGAILFAGHVVDPSQQTRDSP
ncbi:unnamed protein product [Urochloa humidicola]